MTLIHPWFTHAAASVGASILLFAAAAPVFGASSNGFYTDRDGLSCSWYSYTDSSLTTECSGYSSRLNGYVNYSCDYTIFGRSASWNCRSIDGAHWSGSN